MHYQKGDSYLQFAIRTRISSAIKSSAISKVDERNVDLDVPGRVQECLAWRQKTIAAIDSTEYNLSPCAAIMLYARRCTTVAKTTYRYQIKPSRLNHNNVPPYGTLWRLIGSKLQSNAQSQGKCCLRHRE